MGFPLDQYKDDIHGRGRTATLVIKATTPSDAGAPWDGLSSEASDASQDIIMKFKPVRTSDVDGDRVLETDEVVQIYGPDVTIGTPSVGDRVLDDGVELTIKAVIKKQQGDTIFRYDLRVGR